MSFTFKPFLTAYKDNAGLQQLTIRITYQRAHRYAPTGYKVSAKQFNPNNADLPVRSSHRDAQEINIHVAKMISDGKAWVKSHPDATLEDVQLATMGTTPVAPVAPKEDTDFFAFADAHVALLEKHSAYSTFKNVRNVVNHAKLFSKGKLTFEEINLKWAKAFQSYLLTAIESKDDQKRINTAHTYIKKFAHLLRMAMEEEMIPISASPFSFLKWKKVKVRRIPLDESEIQLLEAAPLQEGAPEFHSRNVFLFQFYLAGMRISDVLLLRWEGVDGDRLEYEMKKTQNEMSFPLVKAASAILAYYRATQPPDGFVFPFMANYLDYSDKTFRDKQIGAKTAYVNKYLKRAARIAGLKNWENVSTHIARHTFGNIATLKGLTSYDLRDCFGHSSTKMTDFYTTQFNQGRLDSSLRKVIGEGEQL